MHLRTPEPASSEPKREAEMASASRKKTAKAAVCTVEQAGSGKELSFKIEGRTLAEFVAKLVEPIRSLEEDGNKLGGRLNKALARARRAADNEAATKAKCAADVARWEAKELLLAFLEKVPFSSRFGDVTAGLANVVNASALAQALKEVVADIPHLDLAKYEREEASSEEVL